MRTRLFPLLVLLLAAAGRADPFTVTSTLDDGGAGTLGAGIAATNADADDDTIDFDVPADSTITLDPEMGSLLVTDDLTVDGSTATDLAISNDGSFPLFVNQADELRLRDVDLLNGGLVTGDDSVDMLVLERSSGTTTVSGVISGDGELVKDGAGTVVLEGNNTYDGNTTIDAGTLEGAVESVEGDVTVAAGATLALTHEAGSGTFSGDISGMDGAFEKKGEGTVVLDGNNSYTGGTTISAGSLEGTVTSVPAMGGVDVAADAALVLAVEDDATTDTFSGIVSGAGDLEKKGDGTLVVDAVNTYTGRTILTAGTLQGTVDGIRGNVSTTSGTTLVLDGSGTFAGDVTGGGALTQMGAGTTLVLTGTTSYTGTTTIEGTLELEQDSDNTLSGDITGGGALVKDGSGTLTLTGDNDYTGGTTVMDGTRRGDASGLRGAIEVQADGTLAFDQGAAGEYADVLTGTGVVQKLGTGTLTSSGNSGGFAGNTTVSAGRLDVTGTLGGTVDVSSGGILGGTGQVGALSAAGRVAPGESIGTLAVDGDASFESGSVLEIEFDTDTAQADRLQVTGSATFDAASELRALPASGISGSPQSFDVVTTTGGITGMPSLTDDLAFLEVSAMPVGNDLVLTVGDDVGATFEDFAQTPSQTAIARVLDDELLAGATDLPILDERFGLTESEATSALDDLAGETHTTFTTAQLAAQARLFRSIEARVRGFVAGGPPHSLPEASAPTLPLPDLDVASRVGASGAPGSSDAPRRLGAWLDAYGVFGSLEDGDAQDVEYGVYGTSLGLDHALTEEILVGGAFGYARIDAELDDRDGDSAEANVFQGALYGAYAAERFHLAAAGRFAYDDFETRRRIRFEDFDADTRADFDGFEAGAHLEAGALAFSGHGLRVEPLASLDFAHLDYEGFDESGAGTMSLQVESRDVTSLVTGVGARVHGLLEMGDEGWMTPELRLFWTHEFGDTERQIDARLGGGLTGASFRAEGAEVARDSLVAGVGYTVSLAAGLHVGADYDVWWNADALQHTAKLGVHLSF